MFLLLCAFSFIYFINMSSLEVHLFQYLNKCSVHCRVLETISHIEKSFNIIFMGYPHLIIVKSMFWKKYFRAAKVKNICYKKLHPDPREWNHCPQFNIYHCFLLPEAASNNSSRVLLVFVWSAAPSWHVNWDIDTGKPFFLASTEITCRQKGAPYFPSHDSRVWCHLSYCRNRKRKSVDVVKKQNSTE